MSETDKSTNMVVSLIFIAMFVVVLLLAVALVTNSISQANLQINGINYTDVTVENETGYANWTGYTLDGASAYGFVSPVIIRLYNSSGNTAVITDNVTVSAVGLVQNTSNQAWDLNLSITYSYKYDTTTNNTVNYNINGIRSNIFSMVYNFFSLAPTIGTILAVVILIAIIVLLVLYVVKIKNAGTQSYTG